MCRVNLKGAVLNFFHRIMKIKSFVWQMAVYRKRIFYMQIILNWRFFGYCFNLHPKTKWCRKRGIAFPTNGVSGGEGLDKEVTVKDEVICYENLRYIPRGI